MGVEWGWDKPDDIEGVDVFKVTSYLDMSHVNGVERSKIESDAHGFWVTNE